MATVTDQSAILGLVHIVNNGTITTTFGVELFVGSAYINPTQYIQTNSTVKLRKPVNIYYKMMGYNPITEEYETWHSMLEPLMVPPSGNALENIGIIHTWKDR